MRSPPSWGGHTYNFPGSGGGGYGGGHNLSPTSTDSYGALVHNNNNNNNNTYNQQGIQGLSIKSGQNGATDVPPIHQTGGNYNDPRMFQTQLSHRTSPTNSTGTHSPPQSLSNSYHSDSNININGLQGTHHSYQTSNVHGVGSNSNPAHSFLGTNSVTINNNYLMNVSPGGTLNLPLSKQYSSANGIPRTMEEDANNNQLSHFRAPPTLYETHGSFGYQSNLKHGYEGHMTDQNGNVNGHHGEELDENSTPKVWRPY